MYSITRSLRTIKKAYNRYLKYQVQIFFVLGEIFIYRVSQNYVNTDLKDCGIIYSPRNVCPGFKWYCCSLVIVC